MPFQDIDEYLASLPDDQRAALQALRELIQSIDPSATESISYGMAAFKHRGRPLAYFGAARGHCALYAMAAEGEAFAAELTAFSTSKGTIRFQPGSPIPDDLVRRMLQMRIATIESR